MQQLSLIHIRPVYVHFIEADNGDLIDILYSCDYCRTSEFSHYPAIDTEVSLYCGSCNQPLVIVDNND